MNKLATSKLWLRTTGGLLVLIMLMASCIRVEANIRVEDDGSGTIDYLTALNTEALTSVLSDFDVPESEIGTTDQLCDEFESDASIDAGVPDDATVSPYEEDGFCGVRIQYAFDASDDPSAQIQSVLEDPSARLFKEGDNWFFETSVDTDDLTAEAEEAPQAMLEALFGDASYTITVDLPGRAVAGENNATSVGDDGVFTWEIDILNPPDRLFAQTEPGSGGGTGGGGGIGVLLIGLVLLGLAALAGFFFWKRKNDATTEPEPTAGTAAFAPATMPGGPAMPPPSAAAPGGSYEPATMPVVDGPTITTSPASTAAPLETDASRETVVLNAAELQRLQDEALGTTESATGSTESATASTEPVFDEALNAWVVDDPARGRLRHDPATDTWHPV